MIENLQLKNFQAHGKLDLLFQEGVNVIVGSTDSGKSSVLRALQWVSLNSIQSKDFLRHGEDSVMARLGTHRGEVIRSQSGRKNKYEVDGLELVAFRKDLPDEVFDVLHLDSLNFQMQHDPPFLFSSSPGEVARQLNEVVDLSIIDTSLANVGKIERAAQQDTKYLEGRRCSLESKIEKIVWTEEASKKLSALEEKYSKIKHQNDKLSRILELVSRYRKFKRKRDALSRALSAFDSLAKSFKVVERGTVEKDSLVTYLEQYQKLKTKKCQLSKISDSFQQLLQDCELLESKRKRLDTLSLLVSEYRKTKKEKQNTEEQAAGLEMKIAEITKGKCPVCGGEMNHDH